MSDSDFNFENEIQKASWELLKTHHERGALFFVDSRYKLSDVAEWVAKDNVSQIKILLDNNELRKPNEEEVNNWDKNLTAEYASFVIVQPYVLAQLLI